MSRASPPARRLVDAVRKKDGVEVQAAVAEGADPDTRDGGWPLLVRAANIGWASGVELLLALGANANQTNLCGETALNYAARRDEDATVALLLKGGSNVNATDNYGWTPLHLATRNDAAAAVEVLLRHNANQHATNSDGRTPLEVAKRRGNSKAIKAFENFIASQSTSHKPKTRAVGGQARPSHDEELVRGLMQQIEQLTQEKAEKEASWQQEKASWQQEKTTLQQEKEAAQQTASQLESLLTNAEATIAAGRQRKRDSQDALRIPSRHLRLTDKKLGSGSYGEVRIAYWRGCPVAVKMLYEVLASVQRNIDLLLQEVSIAWQVHHPNVAAVSGVTLETEDGKTRAWIVMDLLQGSMAALIDATQGPQRVYGPLTLREQVDMAHDALCALDYLHSLARPVLHGDIRPTNILVTAVMRAKLGDLGAARFSDASLSVGLVSPEYTAPERMDGRVVEKSKETDMYSMGVTICELFTGATPSRVKRQDQLHLLHQRSVRFQCMQMMSSDPRARPPANVVMNAIDSVCELEEYKSCPPRRMVKGRLDGASDVVLVDIACGDNSNA